MVEKIGLRRNSDYVAQAHRYCADCGVGFVLALTGHDPGLIPLAPGTVDPEYRGPSRAAHGQ
jgi:hypothetical protein